MEGSSMRRSVRRSAAARAANASAGSPTSAGVRVALIEHRAVAAAAKNWQKLATCRAVTNLLQQDILMHRFIEARAFRKNETDDATRGIDDAMANVLKAF
jgi:hypothetical protein